MALDEPKETDTIAEEKGYTFIMDKELMEQVGTVTVNFSYMGFSVDPEKPLSTAGSACGSCSVGGGCGSAQ